MKTVFVSFLVLLTFVYHDARFRKRKLCGITPSPLYPYGSNSRNPLNRSQVGPQIWSETFEEDTNYQSSPSKNMYYQNKGCRCPLLQFPRHTSSTPGRLLLAAIAHAFQARRFVLKVSVPCIVCIRVHNLLHKKLHIIKFVFSTGATLHCGFVFCSPLAGYSLLAYEVS
jgi:hypothetical protein